MENSTFQIITDALNETNLTSNATVKFVPTPVGILIADINLLLMAVIPIFIGALRSVKYHKKQKESGEPTDSISHKDAAMFPLTASATLLGLYIFFQVFSKKYINLLITGYFFILGVIALSHVKSGIVSSFLPANFPNYFYQIAMRRSPKEFESDKKSLLDSKNEEKGDITVNDTQVATPNSKKSCIEELFSADFDRVDIITFVTSLVIGIWYLLKKHWIANNIFGLAFAINAIELLQLNKITTGLILLGGLFIYDIFWVFGTNVMVSVAKSFEAPIKLVFPLDLVEKGLSASNYAMLGLGDIVIPGIFIALLLRYEMNSPHSSKKTKIYFYTSMAAYIVGLIITTVILHVFKHAQPALLYLVPACLGTPMIVGLCKGDLKHLLNYEDNPEQDEKAIDKEIISIDDETKKEL